MFPSIEQLAGISKEVMEEAKADIPSHLIVKHNYGKVIGVMVRKRAGETRGLVAWRLWRTEPKDGVTPFGRNMRAIAQYYVAGGYVTSYDKAQVRMDEAAHEFQQWDG